MPSEMREPRKEKYHVILRVPGAWKDQVHRDRKLNGVSGPGAGRGWGMSVSGVQNFSFARQKEFWKQKVVIAQHHECTQCHWDIHFKWLGW